MPESEPKPKLIELVAPGVGQGWKAVLKSGKPAVVHEINVPSAEAAAAAPRMQRLFEHRHPALSPVLAWGTDTNGLWVAVEPNEGTPLGSILTRGPLSPPAAAHLGAAVLSGVAALHEAGIAMGGFGAAAVRVTTNGDVRLAGHPAAAVRGAPSQSDLRADVRSCGMAVCAAFGVDPAGAPAPQNIPPGLVVTMRSMASGAMGPSADRAQGALREMASALLSPDREMAAQSELATRAGGREVPPITPFLPAGTMPPPPAPRPSGPVMPYTAPAPREETPVRRPASYEAPDRPVQTYPSIPAVSFPPAAAAPPASPVAPWEPVAPAQPKTSEPAVPTWADAPAKPPAPFEAAPAASVTNPPAPPPVAPPPEPATPPPAQEPKSEPPRPAFPSSFDTFPPSGSATTTNPPAAEPVAPPPVPAPPAPSKPATPITTWSTVESPVWKPGEVIPPDFAPPAGMSAKATSPPVSASSFSSAPVSEPAPPPLPRPMPVVSEPARKPTVPRPRIPGGGGLMERPPWLVPGAVAVVIVVLLAIFGWIFIGGRSNNPVAQGHPTPSSHPSSSAKASPTPSTKAPLAVPSYGPASADPLTKIQFCTTNAPCPIAQGVNPETATVCDLNSCFIEVALYFTSGQHVPVHYNLKFFDRCAGTAVDLPGPPAYTPPGYAVVIPRDHFAVQIPAGVKSGALVAVSDQPTTAASAPLLLGSTESC